MDGPSPPARVPQALALAGERVAFTGTLASMTHREAHARVVEAGGVPMEHISRNCKLLVIGEEGWPLESDGRPSVKLQHAERLNAEGAEIRIVRESEWLGFVGLDDRRDDLHRRCTPAMLSRMLDVSVHEIRRWERMGLIRAVTHICRLPYFDFQEVANARRLAQLVEAGVSIRELQTSLARLETVIGAGSRPLAQLDLLVAGRQLLYRDQQGRLKTGTGQRLFDFEGPALTDSQADTLPLPDTADSRHEWHARDWFEEGRKLADSGALSQAVEAFRTSLMADHDAPEVHFHLADALYRQGQNLAALERYYVAVELDHNYLEAWMQIGCLLAADNKLTDAVNAFQIALDVHADFPDAHLHQAETLHLAGRTAEAIPHWRKYLEFDRSGPWAEAARERLTAVGISVDGVSVE